MIARRILVLGGARSGKSRWAERLAGETGRPVTVIATAEPGDAEMAARIARHRAERPPGWRVIEEPLRLADRLAEEGATGVVIVDCLTLWLTNAMLAGRDAETESLALAQAVAAFAGELVLVSNETGLGLVPETPLGRAFRDAQGRLNQRMAEACDGVVFMLGGLPLRLKPPAETARLTLG